MNVEWPHSRCIVCLQDTTLSCEHLIPEALGGKLTANLLCIACNSRIGRQVEAAARRDPSIRLLARTLAGQIPELARKLAENQDYLLSGSGGKRRGYSVPGGYEVYERRLEDGSLIQPTPRARRSLETMLRRAEFDAPFREEALRRLDEAPENVPIEITDTISVVKWTVEEVQPDLRAPLMNAVIPLKIAYTFLAGHLGKTIYEETRSLSAARRMLGGAEADVDAVVVDRLEAPKSRALHGIVFEGNLPHATVQIRHLGQLSFRVKFKGIAIKGPRVCYTHNLETQTESMIALPERQAPEGSQAERPHG